MNQPLSATPPLYDWHRTHGGKMVDFAGWKMPLQYEAGILREHLATRKCAGLFDVSHMGRFAVRGVDALPFLQCSLSNDAAALEPWQAQYTLIPNDDGSVLDDAYLYRFGDQDYLLVVNASNREQDWHKLVDQARSFQHLTLEDSTKPMAMMALQGPRSEAILAALLDEGALPLPQRNRVSAVTLAHVPMRLARTGYTGEPIAFEIFVPADRATAVWARLCAVGQPLGMLTAGLGARDTLRLEAALPLYGHEYGTDRDGRPIPAYAVPLASYAVSFSEQRGSFVGDQALAAQREEVRKLRNGETTDPSILPRRVKPLALLDKGVARQGDTVWLGDRCVGYVTSGTTVPYWVGAENGKVESSQTSERRSIALAYLDTSVIVGQDVEILVRRRRLKARVGPRHGHSDARPCFCVDLVPG